MLINVPIQKACLRDPLPIREPLMCGSSPCSEFLLQDFPLLLCRIERNCFVGEEVLPLPLYRRHMVSALYDQSALDHAFGHVQLNLATTYRQANGFHQCILRALFSHSLPWSVCLSLTFLHSLSLLSSGTRRF
jgi:hypothetical protein